MLLAFHQGDNRVVAIRSKLTRVTVGKPHHVAGELNDGGLHPKADAEERQPRLARIANRLEHSLDSADTEAAWHEHSVKFGEQLACFLPVREQITCQPRDFDTDVVGDPAVNQRLLDALVAVDQSRVLANHGDLHATVRMQNPLNHVSPLREIRSPAAEQAKLVHYAFVETLLVEEQGNLVNRGDVSALDHSTEFDVAEKRNLSFHFLGERALGSADEDVRLNSDFHQLAHRVLRRLCLHLARRGDERNER